MLTWCEGFKIMCNECAEEKALFWETMPIAPEMKFSAELEEEGWTNPREDYHLCPECSGKSQLERRIDEIPQRSWMERVLDRLVPWR